MLNYGGAWIRVKSFTPFTVQAAHLWPLFDALQVAPFRGELLGQLRALVRVDLPMGGGGGGTYSLIMTSKEGSSGSRAAFGEPGPWPDPGTPVPPAPPLLSLAQRVPRARPHGAE